MRKLLLLLLTFATLSQASTIAEAIEKELGLTDAYVWEKKRQILPYPNDPFRVLYGYILSGNPDLGMTLMVDYIYYRHLYKACFQDSPDSMRWLKLHIGKCRNVDNSIPLYLSSALTVITDALLPEFKYSFNVIQGVTPSYSYSQGVSASKGSSVSESESRGVSGGVSGGGGSASSSYSEGRSFSVSKSHGVSYSSGISIPSFTVEEFYIDVVTYTDTEKLKHILENEGLHLTPSPILFSLVIHVKNIKQFEHPLNLPKVQTKASGAGVEISQEELLKWFALYRRLATGLGLHFEKAKIRLTPVPTVSIYLEGLKDIFTVDDVKALVDTLKNDPAFVDKMSRDILDRKIPFRLYSLSYVHISQ
ncbi:MAG: hypothetical protein QXV82_07775 [Ignisphaera sp.]